MPIYDLDIRRTAHQWIARHGSEAVAKVREMVEKMRRRGDVEGADTWLRSSSPSARSERHQQTAGIRGRSGNRSFCKREGQSGSNPVSRLHAGTKGRFRLARKVCVSLSHLKHRMLCRTFVHRFGPDAALFRLGEPSGRIVLMKGHAALPLLF